MSSIQKRGYGFSGDRMFSDIERSMKKISGDVTAASEYTPGDATLWDPQPTTVQEAIDRIVTWLNARHAADMPIT